MENSPANQLPEVDSLPDGFVESSVEPLAPRTPILEEEEKSSDDYKDTLLELNRFSDSLHDSSPSSSSDSMAVNENRITENRVDKIEKVRTFPVTLSEKDGEYLEVNNGEGSSLGAPESGNVVSEASLAVGSLHEHEHVEGAGQSSARGSSEVKATELKEATAAEYAEALKNSLNKKLETSDVKRKNVKRGFKSEKEFLEFTLKYQQVLAERDAAISIREKLESLCRELQRQNKMLMAECKRVSTEGQTMRSELSTKFHDAIKDVSSRLEGQKDECLAQLKENEMLRNKLKHLSEQYAVSEQQFTHKLKQKSLELQIADLKIQQHEEKLIQEQSQMKIYAEQVSQLLATEKNLRIQLAADGEKFQQFQDALLKSNEVFETFKQEIEKMAKSTKDLKKENVFLKSKCERTDVTLIELLGDRENMKKQLEKMKNQKEKLESLCRSLQLERKESLVRSNSRSNPVPTVTSTEEETLDAR